MIGQQIASGLTRASDGRIEIGLNPKELGRVRVSVTGQEGGWVVAIQAERAESADLMRRHVGVLAQEFRDLGFGSLEFSFGERSDDASGSEKVSERESEDTIQQPDIKELQEPRVIQTTGLDVRV